MNFREKSPTEVAGQVKKVNEILGVPITLRSWETMNKYEIEEKYKVRYDAYLSTLRESRKEIKNEDAIVRSRERITMLNNLQNFIDSHQESIDDARDERHASVYQDLQAFLEAGKMEGYVKLPTGVGKTVIFAHLIEALGLRTLVVVPTKVLINQTGERFEQFTDIEFGKLYSKQKDVDSHVTITTYLSFVRNIKSGLLDPTKIPLLILDEAHRALGDETKKSLELFTGIQIGFTATDMYSKDKNVAEVLSECIHSMSLSEAIQEGALATTQTIHAFTEVDLSSVSMSGDEYNQEELAKAVNVAGRNKAAVELYQKAFLGRKTVCYCSGIDHANTLTELFKKNGISSAVITQNTPEESKGDIIGRKEIFTKFKSGEILVLCNARVLVEGFDEDTCSVGFNLHPTRSIVEAEQRGGRPGRLDSANPDKVSTIVDFIDKNAKKKPVLFSEILGGAYVVQKGKKQNISNLLDEVVVTNESHLVHNDRSATKIERDIELLKLISVDDLRISVDSQEVLTVTREYTESREKKEFDFWILKEEVKNAGIQSSSEYEDASKANGWPANSTLRKNKNWKGWDDFLGRTPFEFFNLKKEVISKEVKTSGDYVQMRKDYGWPTVSSLQGKLEWKGWDDFLGREEKKTYTLVDLKSLILELNIKTRNEYERVAPIRKLPSKKGLIKLPGWKGWDDFLGREEKISSFEELQAAVRKSGILNSKDYDSLAPLNNWPAAATVRKNENWKGWDDFLGREVKVEKFDFNKIRKEVIDAKIKSSTEYFECASSHGWPSDFLLRNSPHWTNWDDFLERKPFNFDNLKKDVRSLGIKSSHVYKDMSPLNGWPNETYLRLRPEWKGWDDFLGREEKKLYSFSELKQEVAKHGIYSSKEYGNKSAQLGLPSVKTLKKFPEWKGWDDFLGRF